MCFIGKRKFQEFISEYIPDKPGDIIDLESNQIVGKHTGFHHWTTGQKVRLGGFPSTYYIYKRDTTTYNILVVPGTNHPALYTDMMVTATPHWISTEPAELNSFSRIMDCDFRFQHRHSVIPCTVHKTLDNRLIIQLSQPLRAITEGQFAVLYNGEECLGSAVIVSPGPSYYSMNEEVKMEHWQYYDENMKAQQVCSV